MTQGCESKAKKARDGCGTERAGDLDRLAQAVVVAGGVVPDWPLTNAHNRADLSVSI